MPASHCDGRAPRLPDAPIDPPNPKACDANVSLVNRRGPFRRQGQPQNIGVTPAPPNTAVIAEALTQRSRRRMSHVLDPFRSRRALVFALHHILFFCGKRTGGRWHATCASTRRQSLARNCWTTRFPCRNTIALNSHKGALPCLRPIFKTDRSRHT